MNIRILKPKESSSPAKITVHKTGKMGFSKGAADILDIEKNKYIKFGLTEGDELVILMFDRADDETFSIAKAGAYYYVSAKSLLEDMGIDYASPDTTIFDIRRRNEEGYYFLEKRVIKK